MPDQSSKGAQRTVNCPRCGNQSFYSPENKYRPFCSERCKLIDLGQWADETYKVPSEESVVINDIDQESE